MRLEARFFLGGRWTVPTPFCNSKEIIDETQASQKHAMPCTNCPCDSCRGGSGLGNSSAEIGSTFSDSGPACRSVAKSATGERSTGVQLAAGGTGLAIGAIVGGWGVFAGHEIWHWVR